MFFVGGRTSLKRTKVVLLPKFTMIKWSDVVGLDVCVITQNAVWLIDEFLKCVLLSGWPRMRNVKLMMLQQAHFFGRKAEVGREAYGKDIKDEEERYAAIWTSKSASRLRLRLSKPRIESTKTKSLPRRRRLCRHVEKLADTVLPVQKARSWCSTPKGKPFIHESRGAETNEINRVS